MGGCGVDGAMYVWSPLRTPWFSWLVLLKAIIHLKMKSFHHDLALFLKTMKANGDQTFLKSPMFHI